MNHPARSWQSAVFTRGLEGFAINVTCQIVSIRMDVVLGRFNTEEMEIIEPSPRTKRVVLKALDASGPKFEI